MKVKAAIAFEKELLVTKHHGYNHGYYFINSFIEDHINYHINILKKF